MANKRSRTSAKVTGKKAAKPASARPKQRRGMTRTPLSRGAAQPVLLSGGNPQIAKADGDGPVRAYIAAMPGWKRAIGRSLDALIERTVPGVRKAVKWNSPFYGAESDEGWFLSFHCFTSYVKVTFFRGTSLHPVPPGESKHKQVRYLDLREGAGIDEPRIAAWIKTGERIARRDLRYAKLTVNASNRRARERSAPDRWSSRRAPAVRRRRASSKTRDRGGPAR